MRRVFYVCAFSYNKYHMHEFLVTLFLVADPCHSKCTVQILINVGRVSQSSVVTVMRYPRLDNILRAKMSRLTVPQSGKHKAEAPGNWCLMKSLSGSRKQLCMLCPPEGRKAGSSQGRMLRGQEKMQKGVCVSSSQVFTLHQENIHLHDVLSLILLRDH